MLKEGYKLSGPEMDAHLRSINAYISQFNARNTETELLIDEVNARFIDKLSGLHPDLSKMNNVWLPCFASVCRQRKLLPL